MWGRQYFVKKIILVNCCKSQDFETLYEVYKLSLLTLEIVQIFVVKHLKNSNDGSLLKLSTVFKLCHAYFSIACELQMLTFYVYLLTIMSFQFSLVFFRHAEGPAEDNAVNAFSRKRRRRKLEPKFFDRGYESENSDVLTERVRLREAFMRRSITASTTTSNNLTSNNDVEYDASEEGSIEEQLHHSCVKIFPLLFASVSQPHIFVTASRATQKLEISFYDSSLALSPPNYVITSEAGHRLPIVADFPNHIFQTKPGYTICYFDS